MSSTVGTIAASNPTGRAEQQGETPAPIDLINDASSPATNRSNTSKEPRTANKTDNLEVIDLTEGPDVEIISSSVQKSKPRLFKRPRAFSEQALPVLKKSAMSVQRPAEPESPKGPKCGICLEKMGSSGKNMVAGPCGHVYCKDCMVATVKTSKKCPTCRKSVQVRQLHQVYINFD